MKNEHHLGPIVFVLVLVLNHRLAFQLSPVELGMLASVLGLHQLSAFLRFKSLVDSTPSDPQPQGEVH